VDVFVIKMSSLERVVGRFWKSVGRRMMSEGGEYSDECEYELSVNFLCMKILIGKSVSASRSANGRPKLMEVFRWVVIVLRVHVLSVLVLEERC
jgi:hypothetical protein